MAHRCGVILDIDGTLVDSNDAHAHAWQTALREHGYNVPFDKIRPLIGMGGDKVLPITIGVEEESEEGKQISKRRGEIFREHYLPSIQAFPRARALLERMRKQGLTIAVASSAQPEELKPLLALTNASDLVEEETSAKDVKQSKPDPNVVHQTLQRMHCPASQVIMLGDTAYDIEAAEQAGVKTIALRCGGWSDQDLVGALAIYDNPADLLTHYESSPLAG